MVEELAGIQVWSPPRPLFDWNELLSAVSLRVWYTGFNRYTQWRQKLLKWLVTPGSQDEPSNMNLPKRQRR